jgi:hypothetical protein
VDCDGHTGWVRWVRLGDDRVLSFVSMTAILGTPMDVTLEDLAVEAFYPGDAETAAHLRSGSTSVS